MKQERIQKLYECYTNGNLKSFERKIKKMSKKEFCMFLSGTWLYAQSNTNMINYLANNL